ELGLGDDALPALQGIEQHVGLRQLFTVVGEALDPNRVRSEEAVATGFIRRAKTGYLKRPSAKDCKDVLQRPYSHKLRLRPAHGFRPREAPERVEEDFRDHVGRWPSGLFRHRKPERAFAGVALFGFIEAHQPRALEKTLDGLFGRAHAWTAPFLADIR